MSYPEPLPESSPKRLYKEAKFFYDRYEDVKQERNDLIDTIDVLTEAAHYLDHFGDDGLDSEEVEVLKDILRKG